jgi:phage terminase large subunit
MFEASPLFAANYAATKHKVVNQGGTSSGKTYSILQVLFMLLAAHPDWRCTVVGQDIPNLKRGAMRDAEAIYASSIELQALIAGFNKTDRIYQLHNGSILEFTSYDSYQDAKNGKRQLLFVNECNGVAYPIVKELVLRTSVRCFFDYNPNAEFWIHEQVIGKPDCQLIISDHRHNPFVPQQIRDGIEALKVEDLELWRVYARGKTGKIEGLVFRKVFDAPTLPEGAKYLGTGMDFGFTNDPTTCYDLYQSGGELYVDEILYEPGLTNPDIVARLLEQRTARRWDIVADSAEPKSIEEIRRAGIPIEGAQKGPDSLQAGIDTLKRYTINLLPSCVNLKKEASNYKWKVDRLTGKALNVPVDAVNHGWDALRYIAQARLQAPALPLQRATVRQLRPTRPRRLA